MVEIFIKYFMKFRFLFILLKINILSLWKNIYVGILESICCRVFKVLIFCVKRCMGWKFENVNFYKGMIL